MSNGRIVEGSFGDEMVHDDGLVPAQPVVGIGTVDPVLGVAERTSLGGRRGRHGGHRTAGALLVALGMLLATLLPGLALGAPAQGKADRVVFRAALLGEGVDSLNPFLGIQAPSYEMWGLTYDYLTGYSMTDMASEPGRATRRAAGDRGGRRLRLRTDPARRGRGRVVDRLPQGGHLSHGARRHDRGDEA